MRRKIKLICAAFVTICASKALSLSACAYAPYETPDAALITEQLYHESHADELQSALPEDAKSILGFAGYESFMPDGTDGVTARSAAAALGEVITENIRQPARVLLCIIGIVVLSCALSVFSSGGEADKVVGIVTTLCMTSLIAPPVLSLVKDLAETISVSTNFMSLYVPVISGLIAASGKAAGGAAYAGVMIFASSAVMQITSRIVVPLLKCAASLSVVSASCEGVNIGGVIELFKRASRFLLTFCMSLFAAFLTMKSIVAAASDDLAGRAVKFAVSSFVPLVGGSLSDAYQTVVSCVSVLRSGVGAAAIAAVFAIFIPAAVRCALWQAAASIGAAVCGLFGLSKGERLLSSLSSVVSVMLAVLLSAMVMYIISTAIVLMVGA